MAKVNFKVGSYAKYVAATKDANTLYFITDAKKIFKGDIDVTENIVVVTNFDGAEGGVALANAFEGKFYINITTFETRIKSGEAWITLTPGYITDGTNFALAENDGKFATIAAIKSAIASAIKDITTGAAFIAGLTWTAEDGQGSGKLTVKHGDDSTEDVALNGLPYSFQYDKDALTITIKSYGGEDTVINLPKDNFVRNAFYDSDNKEIVLVVGDGTDSSEVRVPAADFFDVCEGSSSDTITVEVSEGNVIKAFAKIDPVEGNALTYSEDGLKVDISGKVDKLDADDAAVDHILVRTAEGGIADSGQTIAAVISAAVAQVQGVLDELQSALDELQITIDGKIDKVEGVVDNLVAFDAGGAVKDSGKKVGGDALSDDPDADTLATEVAVKAALDAQTISWGTIG